VTGREPGLLPVRLAVPEPLALERERQGQGQELEPGQEARQEPEPGQELQELERGSPGLGPAPSAAGLAPQALGREWEQREPATPRELEPGPQEQGPVRLEPVRQRALVGRKPFH